MKRLIGLLTCFVMFLGVVGCNEMNKIIKERCPLDLKMALEKTVVCAEADGFNKKDVVKQSIIYNEEEDVFYVEVIVKDDLIGTVGDRVDDFLGGKRNKYDSFCYWYMKNIKDQMKAKNINEKVYLRIYNESRDYKSVHRICQ
jgi:hypothetical protein